MIVGGESGPGSRPFRTDWLRQIIDQCNDAEVPVFVKQLGSNAFDVQDDGIREGRPSSIVTPMVLKHKKGGDWDEWPIDLKVREFPQ